MNNFFCLIFILTLLIGSGCASKYDKEWVENAHWWQGKDCAFLAVKSQYDECVTRINESYDVYEHKKNQ